MGRTVGRCLMMVLATGMVQPGVTFVRPLIPLPAAATTPSSLSTATRAYSWNPFSRGEPSQDPRALIQKGMNVFRQGGIDESIELFDRALEVDPSVRPYLWQRGLSLYYANRFQEGAQQFRDDVAVNPSDTEEAIWAFLCEAQMPSIGFDKARQQILKIGRDGRPYMRTAYDLFSGRAQEVDLAKAGEADIRSRFYSSLYLGLYAEVRGEQDKARSYMNAAAADPYGPATNDYMWSLAVVHKQLRGW